jgi:tRNA(fMet)-specific endonuclease VapC
VLVAAERDKDALDRVISDDDDIAIAAITAAELLVGVEMAGSSTRQRRARFVDSILSIVPVETYGLEVARAHARLLAHARRAGRPRGAHDLIIAATAVTSGRAVATADPAGFEDLPGVAVVSPAR